MYRICRLCLLAISEAEEGMRSTSLPKTHVVVSCRLKTLGLSPSACGSAPAVTRSLGSRHAGREIGRCERSGRVETLDAITAQCFVHLHRRLVLHALGHPAAMDTPDDPSPAMMSPPSPAAQEPTRNHPRVPSTVAASRFRFIDP